VQWRIKEGKFELDSEIPANTTASFYIPAANAEDIRENGKSLPPSKDISVSGKDGSYIILQTGSGVYHFSAPLVK
jgi:alpha-L-rhamnosidase